MECFLVITILVRLLNFGATKGISQIFCKKKQLTFISQKIKDWLELPNNIRFQEKMEQSNVYKMLIEKNANLKWRPQQTVIYVRSQQKDILNTQRGLMYLYGNTLEVVI